MVFSKIVVAWRITPTRCWYLKKKQVENEDADFIYLNDDRKK